MTLPAESALSPISEVLCPNCGNFYSEDDISEITGFCLKCSPTEQEIKFNLELYLARNADHIEFLITKGKSLWQALDSLANSNNRPICLVCGNAIKRSKRTAVFCRSTPLCRRYSRRYVYLYSEKNPRLTKAEALAVVMSELT